MGENMDKHLEVEEMQIAKKNTKTINFNHNFKVVLFFTK